VIDRQLQFDASQYGYSNNVGKQHGRSPAEQEAHTRREIEAMKKRGMQQKRDLGRKLDGTRVVGAMPSALLFGMKRQFGDSVIKNPKELAEAHGMWWGD
jgi:hypothetical protein